MAAKKSALSGSNTIYPHFSLDHIKDPNRYWAVPFLGGLAKIIILIPVFIELWFLAIYTLALSIINSFVVLFTGHYWHHCFEISTGVLKLLSKTVLFFSGLTDKYPGFGLRVEDQWKLDFTYPPKPSRYFAIPILGGLSRGILLIPYIIFTSAVSNGGRIGIVLSSVPVLFQGRYPESTYELGRDSLRLGLSQMAYAVGISDKYPSFKISMNHQTIKIFLIIVGSIIMFYQLKGSNWNKDIDYLMEDYTQEYEHRAPINTEIY